MARWTARNRFRVEAVAAVCTAALALLTLFVPDWIEVLTGADPDNGDGSIELLIVVICAALCVVSSLFAWLDYRRMVSGT